MPRRLSPFSPRTLALGGPTARLTPRCAWSAQLGSIRHYVPGALGAHRNTKLCFEGPDRCHVPGKLSPSATLVLADGVGEYPPKGSPFLRRKVLANSVFSPTRKTTCTFAFTGLGRWSSLLRSKSLGSPVVSPRPLSPVQSPSSGQAQPLPPSSKPPHTLSITPSVSSPA